MLKTYNQTLITSVNCSRLYSLCCPPRRPCCPCQCPPAVPGAPCTIEPPSTCRPSRIPANPCAPRFPKASLRRYKYLFLFLGLPLILFQAFIVSGCSIPPKTECQDYEYMRRRTKLYPWGDGQKTLFHNDKVNFLPGECVPPPLDCD